MSLKGSKIFLHLKACEPRLLSISSISVLEIEYGLKLNLKRAQLINPIIEVLLSKIHVLNFEKKDAEVAGNLRAHLQKLGKPIGAYDVLIAAQAMRHGLSLITQNTKEFKQVPALVIEDWLD